MLTRRLYYRVKPLFPWSLRIGLRRWLARRILRRCDDVWPVKPGSEKPPADWPGWPGGKKFAFVLTHDVESHKGLDHTRALMKLDLKMGFRSAFNFIPEGNYETPIELRDELVRNGFEVGVHDLRHDGRLYDSYETFRAHAGRINHYLKEWGASGFRSGFMHHNLDWLHDLNVLYDGSTFDTDPFEPQPDGVGTIFPFWVPFSKGQRPEVGVQRAEDRGRRAEGSGREAEDGNSQLTSDLRPLASGYIELPYTLPQDFTLFVLLREKTIDVWRRKLDWIAQHGGMALVNVHPDYLAFDEKQPSDRTFHVRHYESFLEYLKSKYSDQYWSALPKEVANHLMVEAKMNLNPRPAVETRETSDK